MTRRPIFFLISLIGTVALLGLLAVVFVQRVPLDMRIGNLVIRTQRGVVHPFPAPDRGSLEKWAGWTTQETEPVPQSEPVVSNLIVMIADGVGLGALTSVSSLVHGPQGGLAVEQAPVIGLSRVAATNVLVPDSAAAGTALATGFKTDKGVVSTLPDGRLVKTLFEAARDQGKGTAIMTTSYLADATPACYATHAPRREHYLTILDGMRGSGYDVLIGGQSKSGEYAVTGSPSRDALCAQWNCVASESELMTAELPIFGLFPQRVDAPGAHGPRLATSLGRVLDLLQDRENGFVLMVESEVTDEAGHANDISELVDGMLEFDEAVALATDFAERDGATLVLVLGDHDTGGPGIVSGWYSSALAEIRWLSDTHTASWVPVFAFGAGAESFSGVFDHNDIARRTGRLLGLADFPAILP